MTASWPIPAGSASAISRDAATGVTGSCSPTQTSVGQLMRPSSAHDVEPAKQVHADHAQLRVLDRTSQLPGRRDTWAERREDFGPLLLADRCAAVVAAGKVGHGIARDGAEPVDKSTEIETGHGGLQDQPGGVAGVTCPVQHGDEPAHGVPQNHRPLDAKRRAERRQIVSARLEAPVGRGMSSGSSVPTKIDVNDLRLVGHVGKVRFEVGMVEAAGSTVDEDDCWSFPHAAAVGNDR